MKTTLFLDFDGVLFDTLREAFVLCRWAYNDIDVFEPINENIYKLFYRYKFLVYNSWQYYYVMKLLTEHSFKNDLQFINNYNQMLSNRDLKAEESFDEKYLAKRIELVNDNREFWDTLEKPFEFFYQIKSLYEANKIDGYIVSKKNKFAIEYRLKQYGLKIGTERIFAKEELLPYKTKAEFISKTMEENNIEHSFFIDDNSHNLTPCKEYSQIIPLLAGWGNISIDETGLSPEEIIARIQM